MKIKTLIKYINKTKNSLDQLFVPFISFIAIVLWNNFSNHIEEKFNIGYLKTFGITSKIPINEITSHSKWVSFFFLIMIILFLYLFSSFLYNNTIAKIKEKKDYFFKIICFFVVSLIVSFITIFVYLLYFFCIDNLLPFKEVIIVLFTLPLLWILSVFSALYMTIMNVIKFCFNFDNIDNTSKLNIKDLSVKIVLIPTLLSVFVGIIILDNFFIDTGKLFATTENTYPSFSETSIECIDNEDCEIIKEYIIIANTNNQSLIIEINSDGTIKNPTNYMYKDLENLNLTDKLITFK